MIVKNVRVDWLFIWEPSKKGKYGCAVMLPKTDPQVKEVEAAIAKAVQAGIASGKFTDAQVKSAQFKKCLRDGDAEIETEGRPKHYAGHVFFNVTNKSQPGIVGPDTKPLMDRDKLYSGCYCHLDVNFAPFNNESRGVGAYLNNIMLVKEGERLDGRQAPEEAFSGLQVTDDLQ